MSSPHAPGVGVRPVDTPDVPGYLLATVVSELVCGPLILLWLNVRLGPQELLAAALYLPIALIEVATYGLPVALAGVAVVHLVCRSCPWQWVHVAVAGAAGLGLSWLWTDLTQLSSLGPPAHTISVLVGVSAAVGRAAVVPLVHSRQRRLALDGPVRVP